MESKSTAGKKPKTKEKGTSVNEKTLKKFKVEESEENFENSLYDNEEAFSESEEDINESNEKLEDVLNEGDEGLEEIIYDSEEGLEDDEKMDEEDAKRAYKELFGNLVLKEEESSDEVANLFSFS